MRNDEKGPADIRDLLARTSRTFALAIPLLPEPTQTTVCLAYLLFRVADTLEDAAPWAAATRMAALDEFSAIVRDPQPARIRKASAAWVDAAPSKDDGYLDLLRALDEVFAQVAKLPPGAQAIVAEHVLRTARGMRGFVEQAGDDGVLRLDSLQGLRDYCYVVAGIVGELLTELFIHDAPQVAEVASVLREHQVAFGEGLQLVNILKDERADAKDGRVYLPAGVPRNDVIELARTDLMRARTYTQALERAGAPQGFVDFTWFPRELADATLIRLEQDGPGAKVSRAVVMELLERLQREHHSESAHSGK